MSELRLSYPACVIAGKQSLTAEDLALLRSQSMPEGIICLDQVMTLMAIETSCGDKCPEWHDWFVHEIGSFLVHHAWPQGSLDEINARWFMAMFARDGVIDSAIELDLMLHVLDLSADVPEQLSAFALNQLLVALVEHRGAYAARRGTRRRQIVSADLDYVFQILRGSCRGGRLVLSAVETVVLQAIDAVVAAAVNPPEWCELMASLEERPGRDAARLARWLLDGIAERDAERAA